MARERAIDTPALVVAAAEAFRVKGYHNATIDDIAEAAGISRPTVYKYTKSKQHLLDLMVQEVTRDLGQRIDEVLATNDPPVLRLRNLIDAHIHATIANRTFYGIVFSEEVELSERSRKAFRAWAHDRTQQCARLLDECLDGTDPAIDTTIAANLLESMLATLYRWYDPSGSVPPEELSSQICQVIAPLLPGADLVMA
jgi:AcrR family transcriptional regulator